VGDGHEVSPLSSHQVQQWRILSELESGGAVSQRALSRKLGIALGLTNQLVRELVERKWIDCSRQAPGLQTPAKYRLTPAGRRHQTHVSRLRMSSLVEGYSEARHRIRERLRELGTACATIRPAPRVAFYDDGAGTSEVGWVCLHGTGLQLVGVVGERPGESICGFEVQSWEQLHECRLAGETFDRLVVMSFAPAPPIRAQLRRRQVPPSATFWI
jgi:DNA-binding MarR family transcriptional regulator